jgi:hypothetical protein
MTLSDRASLTHVLKLFDMDANVNDGCSFLTALVVVDRELNLLDNASRGDSLGVIAPIIPRRNRVTDRGASKDAWLFFKCSERVPRRARGFHAITTVDDSCK